MTTTLEASPDPAVTLVADDAVATVAGLKRVDGRDIWICGGARLATTLYEAGLVDRLIVKLNPVLFGSGIPLLDRTVADRPMELVETRPYPSGHVLLTYQIGS